MFSAAIGLVLAWSSSPQVHAMDVPSWVVPKNSLNMPFRESILAQGRNLLAKGRRLQDVIFSDECKAVCPTADDDRQKFFDSAFGMHRIWVVLKGNPAKFQVFQWLKDNRTLSWELTEKIPHGSVNVSDSVWDSVEIKKENGDLEIVRKERVERIEGADRVQLMLSVCETYPGLDCLSNAGAVCENLPDGSTYTMTTDPQQRALHECSCACPKYLEIGMAAQKELEEGKEEGDVQVSMLNKMCKDDVFNCLQAEDSCSMQVVHMKASPAYAMSEECPDDGIATSTPSNTEANSVTSFGGPAHTTTALAMVFAMVPLMA